MDQMLGTEGTESKSVRSWLSIGFQSRGDTDGRRALLCPIAPGTSHSLHTQCIRVEDSVTSRAHSPLTFLFCHEGFKVSLVIAPLLHTFCTTQDSAFVGLSSCLSLPSCSHCPATVLLQT